MIETFSLFAKQLLTFGGFRISDFPTKAYQELLTAIENLAGGQLVMLSAMIMLAMSCPGYLLIDSTNNPKYGLARFAKNLKILTHGGTRKGYEIVLFLWVVPGVGRYPIGFALSYKGTASAVQLALQGVSCLRNHYKLRPEGVLADGAFATDEMMKRLTDYGWRFVMRGRKNRRLSGHAAKTLIGRGYGQAQGVLANGVKLNVVRDRKHFLFCNRMLLERHVVQGLYRLRWKIEEVFRVLKCGIGLDRCQQHSMRAQAIFIAGCLLLFSCLERVSGGKPYSALSSVISRQVDLTTLIAQGLSGVA